MVRVLAFGVTGESMLNAIQLFNTACGKSRVAQEFRRDLSTCPGHRTIHGEDNVG
jgi:hypothetical protein